ncbi:MAG: RtcB family protein [Desulfovibrio sp.]|nr:RtcB family protein [Desulfovibrio sp.]
MIKGAEIREAGIPAMQEIIVKVMKAANIAERDGYAKPDILAFVHCLTHEKNFPEGSEDLQHRFAEVSDWLESQPAFQRDFLARQAPAPWKQWGNTEDLAVEQMQNASELPIAVGGALLPDAHTGYGLPIGGVLAVRNAVIPYAVGMDIACRMRMTVLDVPYEDFEKEQDVFVEALETETRFGVGAQFELWHLRQHPVMEEDWSVSPVTEKQKGKAALQLGTSGCGNHFVEFGELHLSEDAVEPGFTLPAGRYLALLSHSGSRGTGEAVATHYSKLAMSMHPNLPDKLKHLAWLALNAEPGQEYWAAMQLMGRYASANHELIHTHVLKHLGVKSLAMAENHHNFAWREYVDGEELIIHRKGATPAHTGRIGLIPGSMATPGFLVSGKGNPAAYNSCSHGAGRAMSRRAAYQKLSEKQLTDFLHERHVKLISGSLDESPMAYKDIESVMDCQLDLVNILARFDPRLVKMAPDHDAKPFWMKKKKTMPKEEEEIQA